jgi:hypothetical protein
MDGVELIVRPPFKVVFDKNCVGKVDEIIT